MSSSFPPKNPLDSGESPAPETTTTDTLLDPVAMEPAIASSSGPDPTRPEDALLTSGSPLQATPSAAQQPITEASTAVEALATTIPSTGSELPAPSVSQQPPIMAPITFKIRKPARLDSTGFEKHWVLRKYEETDHFRHHGLGGQIVLDYHSGDIFDAPPRTLLIHACNVLGKWGAGIAVEFRKRYPKAYEIYRGYCNWTWDPKTNPVPTGSTLLIPPADSQGHWIGCLFTSARYGRSKDPEHSIMLSTISSVEALLQLVENVDNEAAPGQTSEIGDLRMCKINSGHFGVDWKSSKQAIRGRSCLPYWRKTIQVWVRQGDEDDQYNTKVHNKDGTTWTKNRKPRVPRQEYSAVVSESSEEDDDPVAPIDYEKQLRNKNPANVNHHEIQFAPIDNKDQYKVPKRRLRSNMHPGVAHTAQDSEQPCENPDCRNLQCRTHVQGKDAAHAAVCVDHNCANAGCAVHGLVKGKGKARVEVEGKRNGEDGSAGEAQRRGGR
ncbi:hypothetical protein J1614_001408 [Plenodomus biglobosus]|nr:hypothetical protein J1614_001408 [Plenodomus biglobosus]